MPWRWRRPRRGRWCTRVPERGAVYAKKARQGPYPTSHPTRSAGRRAVSPLVAQMPDAVVAVFRDQQAAIRQLQDAHRAAPNLPLFRPQHPAGEDFAHRPGRLPILERDEGDGLSDTHGAVPGAMEGQEGAALVFLGELLTGVEDEVEHGDVRAQQDVALNRLGHQVRALTLVPRVFVGAGIGVRPTVKGALPDVGEVVGDQVVAQFVALLYGCPKGVGAGVVAQADGVARAGGKDLVAAAVWVIAVPPRAHDAAPPPPGPPATAAPPHPPTAAPPLHRTASSPA